MNIRKRLAVVGLAVLGAGTALTVSAVADPAPAHAYAYYGALALSPSTGATGRAWDYQDAASASSAAVGACGYTDCKVVVHIVNGCGAIASSPSYWGYGGASDLYTAQSNALYNAGGGYIYDWLCTSGHA
ncbi:MULTISPECIES: DUF4189 domain-containing protein [unclassified Gordonia (in: high G+C Gram-positive bacteria)]|uniref:DUF4189 domain-containing protein n=1 Tax=unclassified Gordonia (in: high G+C Gram-positive bacteria) TaxID=2657482 RepID=UPI001FFFF9A0|nr:MULTISPECIES: DUF4189 domain-containing protein [unclassified Gordonia (in: high G+C Gram-positive bacteria)]UQE76410.1 DUF4189 domain-containing protein [Gordonia sp. PP30]